jgi:hypothetical protein
LNLFYFFFFFFFPQQTKMFASHPSVPLSPPVTPKELLARSRSISPEDQLELPPPAAYSAPSSPHAFHDPCRKSNARRYSRAMATADSDCIRFTDPFGVQGNFNLTTPCNRSKPTPKRSPSAAQGSFVMDVSEVFGDRKDDSGLFRKRRNDNEEEQMTAVTVTQNQPTLSASEQRHIKKAKTDAAMAYDGVDITVPDSQVFDDPLWIPDMNAFETQTNLRVVWKGKSLLNKCKFI